MNTAGGMAWIRADGGFVGSQAPCLAPRLIVVCEQKLPAALCCPSDALTQSPMSARVLGTYRFIEMQSHIILAGTFKTAKARPAHAMQNAVCPCTSAHAIATHPGLAACAFLRPLADASPYLAQPLAIRPPRSRCCRLLLQIVGSWVPHARTASLSAGAAAARHHLGHHHGCLLPWL